MGMFATSPARRSAKLEFSSEAALVDCFVSELGDAEPWGRVEVAREWDYRNGITDVLARDSDGELIAFEAKLADWRRAAHQAYRNTVFAQRAFVVLPSAVAGRAALQPELFSRYRIGLCSIGDAGINVLLEAPRNEALVPWLRKRATTYFSDELARRHSGTSAASRNANLRAPRCHA